jgi:hypothetical protein
VIEHDYAILLYYRILFKEEQLTRKTGYKGKVDDIWKLKTACLVSFIEIGKIYNSQ